MIAPSASRLSTTPRPGVNVPRRHYGLLHRAGRAWLRCSGWRIEGDIPDLARVVVAVAPHSSNWDFVHAIAAVFVLGLRVSFIGKHTLFRGPFGPILTWLGGIPVDRAAALTASSKPSRNASRAANRCGSASPPKGRAGTARRSSRASTASRRRPGCRSYRSTSTIGAG